MYKVLVVDDEPIIVDGLYDFFKELKSYSLDVYKAYSGEEALTWLNRKKIDVVVTDIKMPGIDGMQLLEKIRYSWPDCRVVFLTGYEEFEYIYKAIRYEGVSYLLKTESYEKIAETVEAYLEQIQKSLRDAELVQRTKSQLQKVIPILQKEFLTDLIDGNFQNITQNQLDYLEIPLQATLPAFLIVGLIDETNGKLQNYAINFLVEKHIKNYADITYSTYKNYMLWMIQMKKDKEVSPEVSDDLLSYHLKGKLETVQAVCNETLKMKVSFAISKKPVEWNKVDWYFTSLKAMINYCIESGMEVVLIGNTQTDAETDVLNEIYSSVQSIKLQLKRLDLLESYLEQGRKEEFIKVFRETRGVLVPKAIQPSVCYEIFYSLSLLLLSYLNRHGIWNMISSRVDLGRLTQFNLFKNIEEAFIYFEEISVHIFDNQNIEIEKRSVASVQKVQKYIMDNPGGDLSLSSLADMVYFNPKYLSRLFRQITGVNLSDFISDIKINKVKELLRQNNLKVHEIAEYAGYFSAPCFTRFFKEQQV